MKQEGEKTTLKQTLKDLFRVPIDVYPVGRLDSDSEGLLVLTSDKELNHRLLNPAFGHEREYWVQVEGIMNQQAADQLSQGVEITIDGKLYHTAKCLVEIFEKEPQVPLRNPPIRFRKNIPASWIKIIITEGKNRQVRKMTARAGYPTLRLIRHRIGMLTLEGLEPGDIRELSKKEIYSLLFP